MAGTSKDSQTFQEVFYQHLVQNKALAKPALEVEVIAHSYGTDQKSGSFASPITLDVFAVKTRRTILSTLHYAFDQLGGRPFTHIYECCHCNGTGHRRRNRVS